MNTLSQLSSFGRISIKDILAAQNKELVLNQVVTVKGWARSVRKSKKFSFVALNDGSCQEVLQIVVDASIDQYEELSKCLSGTALSFTGLVVASMGKGQGLEMQAQKGEIIGAVDESYPLQKKATSLEFLREIAHLRPRTNTFSAVLRLRHTLTMATHEFFDQRGFFNIHTPIISGADAEGAGEMFTVTTLPPGQSDFSKDFFNRHAMLTVSGQLQGECAAMGLGKIYTFGPTFRAENSNTARHASEFWMIEPEVAFAELEEISHLASDYIKHLVTSALTKSASELDFLHKRESGPGADYTQCLEKLAESKFTTLTYKEAMEVLSKCGKKFEYPVGFDKELQTEHERFLAEEHFKGPVIVTDYPKQFKAFYMKENADGQTVRAMDVLVPGVGELIGGSQREHDYQKLKNRLEALKMNEQALWWYMDLRRFGSVPHGGFGLGFERALMYISGMTNIRDVIAFPRTPGSCDF